MTLVRTVYSIRLGSTVQLRDVLSSPYIASLCCCVDTVTWFVWVPVRSLLVKPRALHSGTPGAPSVSPSLRKLPLEPYSVRLAVASCGSKTCLETIPSNSTQISRDVNRANDYFILWGR